MEFSGNLPDVTKTKEGCCEYKLDGDWTMTDVYDWHRGKDTPLFDSEGESCIVIKDEWALLVKEELKKGKNFKERGSWKGERTIKCCEKENGK